MPIKLIRKKALSNSSHFQSPTVHVNQIFARGLGEFNIDGNLRDVSTYVDIDDAKEWVHAAGENSVGATGDKIVIRKKDDGSWEVEITQYYATQEDLDAASVPADQTFADTALPTNIVGTGTEPAVAWSYPDNQPRLPATIATLQYMARLVHGALESFTERLEARGVLHDADEVAIVHNYISYAHHGTYCVVARQATTTTALTIRQRITFCLNMLLGPADITDVAALDEASRDRTAEEVFRNIPRQDITTEGVTVKGVLDPKPTKALVWVDPRNGKRMHITDILDLSHGIAGFTPESGTATTGLNLDAVGTQSYNSGTAHYVNLTGSWISKVTA